MGWCKFNFWFRYWICQFLERTDGSFIFSCPPCAAQPDFSMCLPSTLLYSSFPYHQRSCLPALPNKPGPLSMSQSHNPISQHPPRPKLKPLTDDPLSNRLNFQFRRLRLRARRPGCTSRRTIRPDGHSTRRLLPQRKLRAAEETRLCVVFSRLGVDRGECAA